MRTVRRILAVVCALLAFAPALALAFAGQQRTVMMQPPGWVQYGQTVAMDFANRRYWVAGHGYQSPLTLTSTSRASIKYCQRLDGIWIQYPSNFPAICDQGVLIEESRTNDALQSRDMTQAAWVKASAGITAALNATGIDGTANSASTLTAAGVAGSCAANACSALQSITLGSSADTYSVWLKRVTGSGTISITINNLTGTTTCTLVTTAFTRCSVTATLANPVIGIAMATVGDVIVADGNQMEPGGFATSPIFTTTTSATRASDVIAPIGAFSSTLSTANGFAFAYAGPLSQTDAIYIGRDSSMNVVVWSNTPTTVRINQGGAVITATIGGSGSFTTTYSKAASMWGPSFGAIVGNYGVATTNAVNTFTGTLSAPTIGSFAGNNFLDGPLGVLAAGLGRPSTAFLGAMTR